MKETIGLIMLATPFVVLFVAASIDIGFKQAIGGLGLILGLLAWVWIGLFLLTGGPQ